jgi:IS5 family transposase
LLGNRSERRLCEEVHLNLAYRWFCRLGLEGKVPDHSTFSENRHGRFRDSVAFRQLFETVLQRCIAEGLVGGEGFAVDAGVVKADAGRQRHRDADDALVGKAGRKITPTDPAASYAAAPGGPAFYACSTNYLADTRHGIIMDVESTTAYRRAEVESTKTMIDHAEQHFGITPQRLIGDTAYGAAPSPHRIVDIKQIEPHTPCGKI